MPKVRTERLKSKRDTKRSRKQSQASGKTPSEGAREHREKRKVLIYGVPTLSTAEPPTLVKPEIDNITETINDVSTTPDSIPSNKTPYTNIKAHWTAHREFNRKFVQNSFGSVCDICDRLWFKNDLTKLPQHFKKLLCEEFPEPEIDNIAICKCCAQSLSRNHVPTLAKFNGFKYPKRPVHLPQLDFMSERLISPRIPFKKIQRLRHMNRRYQNLTQIINIPVSENNMVHHLPRKMNDDYCIYVDVENKQIHTSSKFVNSVNKQEIMTWLQYLKTRPLYKTNDITIDESFFNDIRLNKGTTIKRSSHVLMNDDLIEKQHTLLWNVDKYIKKDKTEENESHGRLFDEYAEELCFPSIYLGEPRVFKEGSNVTPSMMVLSELRRSDRRGVTPDHLLYMAMKIMRMRVHDTLTITDHNTDKNSNTTRQQILSGEYFNHYLQSSLAFLRCIPNSTWYWKERKRDLFAMMRQLGKPTLSLTVSANEISWNPLLQLLYKLKNNGSEISEEAVSELNFLKKTTLVNEDAVTCIIYFNRMVEVLITILKSESGNPFGKYRVVHHFQRIEFRYPRSPCIHILLWTENAPKYVLGADKEEAIAFIDQITSVSKKESSRNIHLQTHQHTSICYKKVVENKPQICQFEAPFMPCRATTILTPTVCLDSEFPKNIEHYKKIRRNLEFFDYPDMDAFYKNNGIKSDEHYMEILCAGITRPRVFLKREPSEKWHEAFNPYILNVLQAHMNIQLILDEDSCADYVVDYVNKTDRGIRDLQRKIIAIMDAHPEFNSTEIIKKLSVDVLNTVEITSQEAAWYLLREPMSKSSSLIIPIQTVWPFARQITHKNYYEFAETEVDQESIDIRKEDWFAMYQTRPIGLETVTLAQFVANYTLNFNNTTYVKRKIPRIIRYRNYDRATQLNEYKREMVTLYVPFRDEDTEILDDMKFLELYDKHEQLIVSRRKEFESTINIQNIIEMCNRLSRQEDIVDDEAEVEDLVLKHAEPDPFQEIFNNENSKANSEFENIIESTSYASVRIKIENPEDLPFQIFSSSPVRCRKTFVTRILMEVYNYYAKADGSCNIYIILPSTRKARATNDGPPTYMAWKIPLLKMRSLSIETVEQYRDLFTDVQLLIIEEISEIDAQVLTQIDEVLKQIVGNSEVPFGGIEIILTGDIHRFPQDHVYGLKFVELEKVIQQSNRIFPLLLTKVARNMHLEKFELQLLESRLFSQEEADRFCPHGMRIFLSNDAADEYNQYVLEKSENKIVSLAEDVHTGCNGQEEEKELAQKLRKMPVVRTAGLPYEITFVPNKSYMLTTFIDDSTTPAPGSIGTLVSIESDDSGKVTRVWLKFNNMSKFEIKKKRKVSPLMRANNINDPAISIERRKSDILLNKDATIVTTRDHFPLVPACAISINKPQGEKLNEVVYEYSQTHSRRSLHTALSQVANINRLYLVTSNSDPTFYHGRKTPSSMSSSRTQSPKSIAMGEGIIDFIATRQGLSILSFNCQTGSLDVNPESEQKSRILLLSETSPEKEDMLRVPDFNCMVRFKRHGGGSGSVVFNNSDNTSSIVTAHMTVNLRQSSSLIAKTSAVGEICAARCTLDYFETIFTVIIYVPPYSDISELISFINEVLLEYTTEGAVLLDTCLHKMPVILSGDFNINFNSAEAQPLIQFLDAKFNLKLNHNLTESGRITGGMIGAVFTRHLDQLQYTSYVSYFRYDNSEMASTSYGLMDTW